MTEPRREGKPVDDRPSWIVANQAEGTKLENLTIDRKDYPYTVVIDGLAPGLPYAVSYFENTHLLISLNAFKKGLAPLVLGHEVRESSRFADLPEEARCKAALEIELKEAREQMPDRYNEYVKDRAAFFDAMVEYYKDPVQAAAKSPQFAQGLQASRDHLRSLVPQETS